MKTFFKKNWFNIILVLWLLVLTWFTYYNTVAVNTVITFLDQEMIPTVIQIINALSRRSAI